MQQLIRTRAAMFEDTDMVSMNELRDAFVLYAQTGNESPLRTIIHPVETGVSLLPKIWVYDETIGPVTHGAPIAVPGIARLHDGIKIGDMVAVMSLKDELVCLGTAKMDAAQLQQTKKGIGIALLRVLMKEGVYPKTSK
jgi:H/ACA ribonucleoprotein complex subunit 4